jgi:hypothetical protein
MRYELFEVQSPNKWSAVPANNEGLFNQAFG